MTAAFCTLALHAAYRQRARALCNDPSPLPWVVLTDVPDDFSDLPVRAVRHVASSPLAPDYLKMSTRRGAYHDKRFALQEALKDFDTAIFLDADSHIDTLSVPDRFPSGLALSRAMPSIARYLRHCGSSRRPVFSELARHLFGHELALDVACWCPEACYAVTEDGNEVRFFYVWGRAVDFLQNRAEYYGEGGVMGLAALYAGWQPDPGTLAVLASLAASVMKAGARRTRGTEIRNTGPVMN